jgi:hypothetical protein
MDVLPTALALAGVDHASACAARQARMPGPHVADACVLDGRDMAPLLLEQAAPAGAGVSTGGGAGGAARARVKSAHQVLFFYNQPDYGNVSR